MVFSPRERQAFCEVYKNICVYYSRSIHPHDVELDHIIPVSKKDEVKKIREKFSLPEANDINDYANILPCCSRCNKQKSDKIYDTTIATFLSKAQENKQAIEKLFQKIEDKYIASRSVVCTIPFTLIFKNEHRKGWCNKGEIVGLTENCIASHNGNYLTLTNDRDDKIVVKNTVEYREAISDGYYAYTTFDMKEEHNFIVMSSVLYNLESAQFPKICNLSNQKFFLDKLDMIDASLSLSSIQISGDYKDYQTTGRTISQDTRSGELKIINSTENCLHLDRNGHIKIIRELLRGDFSNSGYEEILCSVYECFTEGTLGASHMIILSKESPDSLVQSKHHTI